MESISFVAANVHQVTTLRRSIRIVFETQELTDASLADLFKYREQVCYLAIKSAPYTDEDNNMLEALENVPATQGGRTKSQILRGKMFRLWKERKASGEDLTDDFESYYQDIMAKIIEIYDRKIVDITSKRV